MLQTIGFLCKNHIPVGLKRFFTASQRSLPLLALHVCISAARLGQKFNGSDGPKRSLYLEASPVKGSLKHGLSQEDWNDMVNW